MPVNPLLSLLLLPAMSAPADLTICDFDTIKVDWRSKLQPTAVVETTRDGQPTHVLHLKYDLSQAPRYDWLRASVPDGVDVRPYQYLTFAVKSTGEARLMTMMIRRVPRDQAPPNGELVAAASRHWVEPPAGAWQLYSVPLSAYADLDQIAAQVTEFNFSLIPPGEAKGPGELWLDDLLLTTKPRGTVLTEQVPFPPADIAVKDEAEFFSLLDLTRPALADVKAAVEQEDWTAAKQAWAKHLETRTSPKYLWSRRDRSAIEAYYATRGGLDRYLPRADTVLARDFNWLGVRKQLKHDVDWLQGPVEWTHVLSRFGYWTDLGLAWWASGDAKYADDFVFLLQDWIRDNPVPRICTNSRGKHGTVWRTLETGIRGENWWHAMELFLEAPSFDAEAKYLMCRSLVEQARHLHRYTVAFRKGNWQVVECTGLAATGIMLPEAKESEAWRQRAFESLRRHMADDVYPDGGQSELTPGYHSWVMQEFLKVALLCKANGYDVPGLLDRHEKMFEFLEYLTKPDHKFPPLGDAGSGGSSERMLGLGALLYQRPDFRYLGLSQPDPGWIWLFGPQAMQQYLELPSSPPAFNSSRLPESGYLVQRTGWSIGDRYLLFDAAPWGGGHSHQDRLQVILFDGRDLLLDSGQYSYDQPLSHQYFRQSAAHNILVIDDQQQLQDDPQVTAWQLGEHLELASATIAHGGFSHQRTVVFVKPDYWVVVDHVNGPGEHKLTRQFHFPGVEVQHDATSARTGFKDGRNVWVASATSATVEMVEGWLPTGGATAERSPVLTFVEQRALPAVAATVIVPFSNVSELPTVSAATAGSQVAMTVTFPDGRTDQVALRDAVGELRLDGQTKTGRAWWRRGEAEEVVAK